MTDPVDFQEKKKQKAKKKATGGLDNATIAMKAALVCDILNDSAAALGMKADKRFFIGLIRNTGVRAIYVEQDDGCVRFAQKAEVKQAIYRLINTEFAGIEALHFCASNIDYIVEYWIATAKTIVSPATLAFKDADGLAMARLDFDVPPTASETPTWDGLCARMSCPEVFRAFIGSLFDPGANLQQYLWVHGAGNDGKGAIVRFLKKILGEAFVSVNYLPQNPSPFFTSRFLNRRLCVFPELGNTKFVANDLFKSLVGQDPQYIEFKGKDGFTTELDCRYLITSNTMPEISTSKADLRRALFITIESGPSSSGFEERLFEERGSFIARCLDDYLKCTSSNGLIMSDEKVIRNWAEALEEDYEICFERWFVTCPRGVESAASDLTRAMNNARWRKDEQIKFRNWLKRVKGLEPVPLRINGSLVKIFNGYNINIIYTA